MVLFCSYAAISDKNKFDIISQLKCGIKSLIKKKNDAMLWMLFSKLKITNVAHKKNEIAYRHGHRYSSSVA